MMDVPKDGPLQRLLLVLIVAAVVTFALWGGWLFVAALVGLIGWLFSAVGNLLTTVMELMMPLRGMVALIAFVCGVMLGGLLVFAGIPLESLISLLRRPFQRDTIPDPGEPSVDSPESMR